MLGFPFPLSAERSRRRLFTLFACELRVISLGWFDNHFEHGPPIIIIFFQPPRRSCSKEGKGCCPSRKPSDDAWAMYIVADGAALKRCVCLCVCGTTAHPVWRQATRIHIHFRGAMRCFPCQLSTVYLHKRIPSRFISRRDYQSNLDTETRLRY